MKNRFKIKDIKIILKCDEIEDICMCPDDYFEFYKIKSLQELIVPNLSRYQIHKGLYGSILGKTIWTHQNIPRNYIKIFPKGKYPESNLDEEWSINISIFDFEKMMRLKAYW